MKGFVDVVTVVFYAIPLRGQMSRNDRTCYAHLLLQFVQIRFFIGVNGVESWWRQLDD